MFIFIPKDFPLTKTHLEVLQNQCQLTPFIGHRIQVWQKKDSDFTGTVIDPNSTHGCRPTKSSVENLYKKHKDLVILTEDYFTTLQQA